MSGGMGCPAPPRTGGGGSPGLSSWGGMGGMRTGGFGEGGGGIFNVGKANATVLNAEDKKVDISFKDVAGLDEADGEIMEFV